MKAYLNGLVNTYVPIKRRKQKSHDNFTIHDNNQILGIRVYGTIWHIHKG